MILECFYMIIVSIQNGCLVFYSCLSLRQNLNFSCCRMDVQYLYSSDRSIHMFYLKHCDSDDD